MSQSLNVNSCVRTANPLSSRLEKLWMGSGELGYCLKKIFDHVITITSFVNSVGSSCVVMIRCPTFDLLRWRSNKPASGAPLPAGCLYQMRWKEFYLSHLRRGHLRNACTPSSPSHNHIQRHGLRFRTRKRDRFRAFVLAEAEDVSEIFCWQRSLYCGLANDLTQASVGGNTPFDLPQRMWLKIPARSKERKD